MTTTVNSFGASGDDLTDNSYAIQRCIDSLPSGGRIVFDGGVYRFNRQIKIKSGITLDGRNEAVLKPVIEDNHAITALDSSEIKMKDIKFDGSAIKSASKDSAIIRFNRVHDLEIENCKFKDLPMSAIILMRSDQFALRNNFVDTTGTARRTGPRRSIEQGGGFFFGLCKNGEVINNRLWDLWAVGMYLGGAEGCRNILIENNLLKGNISTGDELIKGQNDNGIRLDASSVTDLTDMTNIMIRNNRIIDIDGSGIRVSGSHNSVIGNTIQTQELIESDQDPTHMPHGIHVDGSTHCIVSNNTVYDATNQMEAGIKVAANQGIIDQILIVNNMISAKGGSEAKVNGHGISMRQGSGDKTVSNISVIGNNISNLNNAAGMYVRGLRGFICNGNRISNVKYGLYFQPPNDRYKAVSRVDLSHNDFQNISKRTYQYIETVKDLNQKDNFS